MTPKEKAEKLITRYSELLEIGLGNTVEELGAYLHNKSKQCALIAVHEIIEVAYWNGVKEYWNEVKQEIEKL